MRFRDVAYKSFTFNMRKYVLFFLCNVFSIAILLIYGNLLYNPEVIRHVQGTMMEETLNITYFILMFFPLSI